MPTGILSDQCFSKIKVPLTPKLGLFGGGGGGAGGHRIASAQVVRKGGKIRHADWPDCLAVCAIRRLLETCARAGWGKHVPRKLFTLWCAKLQ